MAINRAKMKKGSQQAIKAPVTIANVLAALRSLLTSNDTCFLPTIQKRKADIRYFFEKKVFGDSYLSFWFIFEVLVTLVTFWIFLNFWNNFDLLRILAIF